MYLESGKNTTLLEERFKTRIREDLASITDATTALLNIDVLNQ